METFNPQGKPDTYGRTIRKVMGGGWGENQKKNHARENAKKKIRARRR